MTPEEVGERLRQLRQAAAISSTDLGQRLGVSHTAVLDWERGKSQLTLQRLQAYAEAVNADVLVEVLPEGDPRGTALKRLAGLWDRLSAAEQAAVMAMLGVWEQQHQVAAAGLVQRIK